MKLKRKIFFKGFTIFEFLIIFIIIAFIILFVFIEIQPARAQARDARRISDLNALKAALQLYYMNKGVYPDTPSDGRWCPLVGPEIQAETIDMPCIVFFRNFIESLEPYIDQIPKDPLYPKKKNGKTYSYQYKTLYSGTQYKIHADLETREPYEVYSSGGLVINGGEGPGAEQGFPPSVVTYEGSLKCKEKPDRSVICNLLGEIVDFGSSDLIVERGFKWKGITPDQSFESQWTETISPGGTGMAGFPLGIFAHEVQFNVYQGGCINYYYTAMARDPETGWGYGTERFIRQICDPH